MFSLRFFCFFLISALAFPCFSVAKRITKNSPLLINGAGASFPYILYSKWFFFYRKVDPEVMINYRSIGSGGGIRQFLKGTLDFGASDVPMSKKQMEKIKGSVLHIPTTLGAVVISYNIDVKSEKKEPLRLTGPLLVDIYMGKVTRWNDKKIAQLNPKVSLPDQNIVTIHRADGSGTTAIFTEYLAQYSTDWLKQVGKGKAVNWPKGIGGKGNEGVMGLVRKIPGAIGYIAMSYAMNRNLIMAELQNASGYFVKPSIASVTAAAEESFKTTNDLFWPLVFAKGKEVYPMSSYTYLLVYREMQSKKGKAFLKFLNWLLNKGQSFCEPLHYAPLPQFVLQKVKEKVQSIKVADNDKI